MSIIQYIDRSPNIILVFASFSRVHIFRKFSILGTFRDICASNIFLFYLTIFRHLVCIRNWYWNLFYFVFMIVIYEIDIHIYHWNCIWLEILIHVVRIRLIYNVPIDFHIIRIFVIPYFTLIIHSISIVIDFCQIVAN